MTRINPKSLCKVSIVAALVTTLGGCGAFTTKSSGEKSRQNNMKLNGEWKNDCLPSDWLGLTKERGRLKFSALGDFDKTTTIYSDEACNTPATELSERGTYASLGKSREVSGARDINFTIAAVTVTPLSDDAAKLMNDATYCDIADWKKGSATDVLGKNCMGTSHPSGEVIFDVYDLKDKDRRLTLGKGSLFLDRSDATSRPGKLDGKRTYTKQ